MVCEIVSYVWWNISGTKYTLLNSLESLARISRDWPKSLDLARLLFCKRNNRSNAHAVIDTTLDTHLNCMCQRDAYAHTQSQML